MLSHEKIRQLVQAHTRYTVKCECGEYLLKRENGFMSERKQWEMHLAKVLFEALSTNRLDLDV